MMMRRLANFLTRAMTFTAILGCLAMTILWPSWRALLRAQGYYNRVADSFGVVGGGNNNQAGDNVGTTDDRRYATVAGGVSNNALGERSAVGGGTDNIASEFASTVPGGAGNAATGTYSFAAGRRAKASHAGSFVWSDSTGADFFSSGVNQFLIRAGGGVGINTISPSSMLDVAGDIRTSNGGRFIGDGSGLTSLPGFVATTGGNTFNFTQTIATGNLTLPGTTDANNGVINSGGTRFIHRFGGNNTFVGDNSGNFTMTGANNSSLGINTLLSNTAGNDNTAIGAFALLHNASGGDNTANGSYALHQNTTGYGNTASGAFALLNNTNGSNNVATGLYALLNNTTGNDNVANGALALYSNTTGFNNTATGRSALQNNTSGVQNTANGLLALSINTSGNNNTAVGYSTMALNTTGGNNTATGTQSLFANTTGGQNTATGQQALRSNTTGVHNTATGFNALELNASGNFNLALGSEAGDSTNEANANINGSSNTFLGAWSGPGSPTQVNNATALGANAVVTADNAIVLGSIAGVNGAASGVNVGIGTAAPAAKLEVVGDVKVTGTPTLNGVIFPDGTKQTTANPSLTNIRGINFLVGCETCALLPDGYAQPFFYVNVIGPMSILSITCFSDALSTPLVNVYRDDGTGAAILSSSLACSAGGTTASTFVPGEEVLGLNDKLHFFVPTANGAKRVTLVIKTQVN
jgi:trimeric autotransporter adhesin